MRPRTKMLTCWARLMVTAGRYPAEFAEGGVLLVATPTSASLEPHSPPFDFLPQWEMVSSSQQWTEFGFLHEEDLELLRRRSFRLGELIFQVVDAPEISASDWFGLRKPVWTDLGTVIDEARLCLDVIAQREVNDA